MTFEEFVPCGTPFPRSPRNLSANVCCTHGGLVHLSAFLTFFWHVLVRRTSRLFSLDKQETVLCSTLLLFRCTPERSDQGHKKPESLDGDLGIHSTTVGHPGRAVLVSLSRLLSSFGCVRL